MGHGEAVRVEDVLPATSSVIVIFRRAVWEVQNADVFALLEKWAQTQHVSIVKESLPPVTRLKSRENNHDPAALGLLQPLDAGQDT